MNKIKIYLDTSVISHLQALDVPIKMKITNEFWNMIMINKKYSVYISEVVLEEIDNCKDNKKKLLLGELSKLGYILIERNEKALKLQNKYLENNVLKIKSKDDLLHIALAIVSDIDYIVSWNFKHFVNIKTITKVNEVNINNGYGYVNILSPESMIKEVKTDGK